jgi:hypothetical protein
MPLQFRKQDSNLVWRTTKRKDKIRFIETLGIKNAAIVLMVSITYLKNWYKLNAN